MTNFARPKPRFDRSHANDGVWYYIEDEVGNDYGGFLCGYFDVSVPRVKVLIERAQRIGAGARAKRVSDADQVRTGVEQFVDACLLDWDIKDADGKSVKFSRDAAVAYFLTADEGEDGKPVYVFDYVFSQLLQLTRDVRNYQSDAQLDAGDSTGN